jgi:hypothetical protein
MVKLRRTWRILPVSRTASCFDKDWAVFSNLKLIERLS